MHTLQSSLPAPAAWRRLLLPGGGAPPALLRPLPPPARAAPSGRSPAVPGRRVEAVSRVLRRRLPTLVGERLAVLSPLLAADMLLM